EGAHFLLEVECDRESKITARPLAHILFDAASHQEVTAGDDPSGGDHGFLYSHGFQIAQIGPHHDAGGAPAVRQKADCAGASYRGGAAGFRPGNVRLEHGAFSDIAVAEVA